MTAMVRTWHDYAELAATFRLGERLTAEERERLLDYAREYGNYAMARRLERGE